MLPVACGPRGAETRTHSVGLWLGFPRWGRAVPATAGHSPVPVHTQARDPVRQAVERYAAVKRTGSRFREKNG